MSPNDSWTDSAKWLAVLTLATFLAACDDGALAPERSTLPSTDSTGAALIQQTVGAEAAAIAFDAASSASGRSTSLTWAHTIGGGADRLLVVGIGVRIPTGNNTTVAVRYNGVDLTPAGTERNGPVLVEVWYALEATLPAAGTYDVEITTTGGDVKELNAGATSVTGAAQGTPEALTTSTASQVPAIATGITTLSANAWVFDAVAAAATGNWTPDVGQTERWDATVVAAAAASSTTPVATPGATTITQAFSVTANRAAHVVLAVAPAPPSLPEIAFDAASDAADRNTALSWAHTIGGDAERTLVVGVGVRIPTGQQTDLTVRYAGVDLTRAGSERNGPVLVELWYQLEAALPATGTHAVDITTAGGDVKELIAGAVSLAGVNQGPPEAFETNSASQRPSISTEITTVTDNAWVIDAVGAALSGVWTPDAPQLERWDRTVLAAAAAGSTRPVVTAGTVTTTQTFSATANRTAHVVVALAPAPPPPPPVASVDVSPSSATIDEGFTVQLTAQPQDAANNPLDRPVTWATDDPGVATVDPTGLVTGVAAGQTTITATSEGVDGTADITVTDAAAAIYLDGVSSLGARSPLLTWQHVIGGGADRVLVVGLTIETADGPSAASVTYAGVPLTRAVEALGGTRLRAEVWYLLDASLPAAGMHVVQIETTGDVREVNAGALSFTGVAQHEPEATGANTAGSSTEIVTAITTLSDDAWVVDVSAANKAGSFAPGGQQTEQWDVSSGSATGASSTRPVPTAGPVNLTHTFTGGSAQLAHVVIALAPSGAASPPPTVATVDVTPASATVDRLATVQLSAQPRDASNNPLSRKVVWSSDNSAIASVDSHGLVTGGNNGNVTITATSEGVDGTAAITVGHPPVASVAVTPDPVTVEEGLPVQFLAEPRDATNNALADRTVTWSSLNSAIASVSNVGTVVAGQAGSTDIVATSEGVSGTATITVVPLAPTASVTVSPASAAMASGSVLPFTAEARDGSGVPLPGRRMTWTSGDASVAFVDQYQCTLLIGFSIPGRWFSAGFEAIVGDDEWEKLVKDGGTIHLWADPGYAGWSGNPSSPCTNNPQAPDRAVLVITPELRSDPAEWAGFIHSTIDNIHDKYPSVRRIVLQPVIGGPNHEQCFPNGTRATYDHPLLDDVIATVVGGDVVAGFSPEAETCDDFDDFAGHMTQSGYGKAAWNIGQYYATTAWVDAVASGATTITATSDGTPGTANVSVDLPQENITFDAASSASDRNTALTWSHTIGDAADRLLVVGVGVRIPAANQTTVTVRYGGVDLTRADAARNGPILTELWYALETTLPATGTHTVEITTVGGDVKELNAGAISVSDAAQTAPEALATNTASQSTAIDTDVTTLTNNAWVFDVVGAAATGTWTPGAAQTERWDETVLAASAAGSTRPVAPAGLTTITQTFDAIANRIAHVVMAVAGASTP